MKARKNLRDAQARHVEVEQEAKLVRKDLDKILEQSVVSAKAAKKTLRLLTGV